MALQGKHIFDGYLKNRGMVRVYQDLDNSNFVFAIAIRTGEEFYLHRSRVSPRRIARLKVNSEVTTKGEQLKVEKCTPTQECLF